MALAEIRALALALNVTEAEVYKHSGVAGSAKGVASTLPAATPGGTVETLTGVVTFNAPEGADVVSLRSDGDGFVDHVLVLVRLSDVATADASAPGVGVLRLADGSAVLGKFQRGFTAGRYDVGPAFGIGQRRDDVAIVGVIPVVGLVPVLSASA